MKAIALATAVNRDWFSTNRNAGRPRGANSSKGIEIRGYSYHIPLSITEVIAAVRPFIDDLAGASNIKDCIPVLRALVAVVELVIPAASCELIARIATRVKADRRNLENPLAE